MAQILDPVPNDSNYLLCCYVNTTSSIQVARITNIENWYFERVIFPGQRLIFEALPEAILEIHSGMMATAILADQIPCSELAVNTAQSETDMVSQNQEHSSQQPTNAIAAATVS